MRTTKAAFTEIKLPLLTSVFMTHARVERVPVLSSDDRWKNRKHKGTVVISLMLKDGT